MGAMTLPASGRVYIDTSILIYTVERFPAYWHLIEPLWLATQAGTIETVSSELTLLEAMVGPLKRGDSALEKAFEQALLGTELRLLPITQSILRTAAKLRATTKIKTPDALHLATAEEAGCSLLVTNDSHFRGVCSMSLAILDDLLQT